MRLNAILTWLALLTTWIWLLNVAIDAKFSREVINILAGHADAK